MTSKSAPEPSSPWRSIRVDPDTQVALWVQLKTQIQYLITTGAVDSHVKLPAVRTFANDLGIAVDTVRKAYEALQSSGLVRTVHGRGTFTSRPGEDEDQASPGKLEWKRVDHALLELAHSGVDLLGSGSRITQRLSLLRNGASVVFVGVGASVERYAREISEAVGLGIEVRALPLDDLRKNRADLGDATYVICLVGHRTEVNDLLAGRPLRILSLTSSLPSGLLDPIPAGNDGKRIVLVARPETHANYLSIIRDQRPDLTDIEFVPDNDEDLLQERLAHTDVVLHTSVAASIVSRIASGSHRLIELRHAAGTRSLETIRTTLQADLSLLHDLISPTTIAQAAPPQSL
ncbi:MAG: GntR family transcriptional regulator [Brevibacterium sp.]